MLQEFFWINRMLLVMFQVFRTFQLLKVSTLRFFSHHWGFHACLLPVILWCLVNDLSISELQGLSLSSTLVQLTTVNTWPHDCRLLVLLLFLILQARPHYWTFFIFIVYVKPFLNEKFIVPIVFFIILSLFISFLLSIFSIFLTSRFEEI